MTAIVLRALLETSLYAAVLYVAVAVFRRVLGDHAGPRLRLALWGLLLVRLMLPITWEAPVRLIHWPAPAALAATAAPHATAPLAPAAALAQPTVALATAPGAPADMAAQPVQVMGPLTAPVTGEAHPLPGNPPALAGNAHPAVAAAHALAALATPTRIACAVWLAGVLAGVAVFATQALRLRRRLRQGSRPDARLLLLLHKTQAELGLRRVPVLLVTAEGSPALTAGLRPRLLVPRWMAQQLDEAQLTAALRHELTHWRRGDHLLALLLLALRCVYWFHPAVWLMARQMREDLELACDAAVVKDLDLGQRRVYAQTLLALYGRGRPRLALPMAGSALRAAQLRLQRVFQPRPTAPAARFAALALSAVLVLGCFTTACQPKALDAAVAMGNPVGTASAHPEATASAPEASAPAPVASATALAASPTASAVPAFAAPAHIYYTLQGAADSFSVQVDADVQVPASGAFPSVRVTADTFSQDVVDRVRQALLPGVPLYEPSDVVSKGQVQTLIDYYQKEYDASVKDGIKASITAYKKILKDLKAKQAAAPDTVTLQLSDTTLHFTETYTLKDIYGHLVMEKNSMHAEWSEADKQRAREDGNASLLAVTAYDPPNRQMAFQASVHKPGVVIDGLGQFISYDEYQTSNYHTPFVAPNAQGMTQEEAIAQAGALLQKIGVDVELQSVQLRQTAANPATGTVASSFYALRYLRNVGANGQRLQVGVHLLGMQEYVPPYVGEQITLFVDNSGVLKFQWGDPVRVDAVEDPGAPLLSFDKIQAIADQQLKSQESALTLRDKNVIRRRIVITQVTLSSMPVRIQGQPASYRYVPVWDFSGKLIDQYAKGTHGLVLDANNERVETGAGTAADAEVVSFATINATDGSVIDRNRGY